MHIAGTLTHITPKNAPATAAKIMPGEGARNHFTNTIASITIVPVAFTQSSQQPQQAGQFVSQLATQSASQFTN